MPRRKKSVSHGVYGRRAMSSKISKPRTNLDAPARNRVQIYLRKSVEDLAKMQGEKGREEMIKGIQSLRRAFARRVKTIQSSGHYSYALDTYVDMSRQRRPLKSLTRNQMIAEIISYQKFFEAETSSVKGILNVNREQDIRIFGADENGNPRYNMSDDERQEFWSVYDEFIRQNRSLVPWLSSGQIQQTLAEMQSDSRKNFYSKDDFTAQLTELKNRLLEKPLEESVPNVFMGRGDDWEG